VTARSRTWPVRLAAAAEDDFQDVLRWTAELGMAAKGVIS
jgi:hypothetical protein